MSDILTLILAAGKSTRMQSTVSKILHPVASRPIIEYVLELAQAVSGDALYTMVNPGRLEDMQARYPSHCHWIIQEEQKGTGHAVQVALDKIDASQHEYVLVLYGDSPLLTQESLEKMLALRAQKPAIVLSTMSVNEPNQYGRVVEAHGQVQKIVEYKEASEEERNLSLCNGGVMLINLEFAKAHLSHLKPAAQTGEFYLTDLVEKAVYVGQSVLHHEMPLDELLGVNKRTELAHVEAIMQDRLREKAMLGGATLIDPKTTYLAHDTKIGRDVLIEPNVFFGPKVVVEDGVHIKAFSHLENCHLQADSKAGPFARLRPGTVIGESAAVGNFVEVKNATLHKGVKAGHLSYLGDADIHAYSNIGAGTITCNYDGKDKHKTVIGAGAFIGSNTALVAPVHVGVNALVGAGSVITKNVPDDMLAVARGKQKNLVRKK